MNDVLQDKKYLAFISYRHADNKEEGRQWATWLHHALETYEIPEDLIGTPNERGESIPESIYPIFRDEDELPADADLGGAITRALDATNVLVVLCSPRSVESKYVADEIDYFKSIGGSSRIIAAIIDGEPNASWDNSKQSLGFAKSQECFPSPLQFEYSEKGVRTNKRAEPVAADFRLNDQGEICQGWTSRQAYQAYLQANSNLNAKAIRQKVDNYETQKKLMLLKIVAGILGLPLSKLTQRDKQYQLELERKRFKALRNWLAAVACLAVLAVGAGVLAYRKTLETEHALANVEQERQTALYAQSKYLYKFAANATIDHNNDQAMLLALNGLPGAYGGKRLLLPHMEGLYSKARNFNSILAVEDSATTKTSARPLKHCQINDVSSASIKTIAKQVYKKQFGLNAPFICWIQNPSNDHLYFYLDYQKFDRISAMLSADERPNEKAFEQVFVWNKSSKSAKLAYENVKPIVDMKLMDSGVLAILDESRMLSLIDPAQSRLIDETNLNALLSDYYSTNFATNDSKLVVEGQEKTQGKGTRVIRLDPSPKRFIAKADRGLFFFDVLEPSSTLLYQTISFAQDQLLAVDQRTGLQLKAIHSLDTSDFQDTSLSDSQRPLIGGNDRSLLTQSAYNKLELRSLPALDLRCTVAAANEIMNSAFNSSGSQFAVATAYAIKIYSTQSCDPLQSIETSPAQGAIVYAGFGRNDDELLIHQAINGGVKIELFNLGDKQRQLVYQSKSMVSKPSQPNREGHFSILSRSRFVGDKVLASSHVDQQFKLIDPNTHKVLLDSFQGHPDLINFVVDSDAQSIFLFDPKGVTIYDIQSGEKKSFLAVSVVSAIRSGPQQVMYLSKNKELFEMDRDLKPRGVGFLPKKGEFKLLKVDKANLYVFNKGQLEIWNLNQLKQKPAPSDLPVGRTCLSKQEREQFYLPELSDIELKERGCPLQG